jgi:hypothetical protein
MKRFSPLPRVFASLLMLLSLAACAGGGGGERSTGNRDILTREEMETSVSPDLFSIVQERRPRWIRGGRTQGPLSPQGGEAGEAVVVYFDNSRQGGVEALRGLPIDGVREVRFLSGPDAQQRFGLDHRMGAILVFFGPVP